MCFGGMSDQKLDDLVIDYVIKMEGPETAAEIAKGIGAKRGKDIQPILTSYVSKGVLVSVKVGRKTLYDINNENTIDTGTHPPSDLTSTSAINIETPIPSNLETPLASNETSVSDDQQSNSETPVSVQDTNQMDLDFLEPLLNQLVNFVGQIKVEMSQIRNEMALLNIAMIPQDNLRDVPNTQSKNAPISDQQHAEFITPKKSCRQPPAHSWGDPMTDCYNRFQQLAFVNNETGVINQDDDTVAGIGKGIESTPTPTQQQETLRQQINKQLLTRQQQQNQHYQKQNKQPQISEKQVENTILRPGVKTYAKAAENITNTVIVTDSMCRSIRNTIFNSYLDTSKEQTTIHKFPGATASQIKHYSAYCFNGNIPTNMMIVAGTNDVAYDMNNGIADPNTIANRVVEIAKQADSNGVKNIFIASIMKRKGEKYKCIIDDINLIIRIACMQSNFYFIDNNNITEFDLHYDGLHLNATGTEKLAINLLKCCSSYNPYLLYDFDQR